MTLHAKKIILGITGGVAAYKAAELARLWVKAGYTVQTVMTEAASHFIGTATLQALTGRPALTDLWGTDGSGMDHIHASRDADLIVVAPASANFMSRLTQGRADDLLATLCLARACPLMLAPAMNREMWRNPATQTNFEKLRAEGVSFIGPAEGEQACGETGPGRMSEPRAIFDAVERFFAPGPLHGKTVLLTAGPTYEPIDPVRGITNLSSGKMGYALATAAQEAGADVILVSGPTCLRTPVGVSRVEVTRASEMLDAVMAQIHKANIFIGVAAVADYRPAWPNTQKIKKSEQSLTLELLPNEDILASVAGLPNAPFCVGFAAETQNLLEFAEAKRQKKRLPMLVANRAQEVPGADTAELVILDNAGSHTLPRADKSTQARLIIRHLISLLP